MKTTLIIIWLLLGLIAVWRTYFGQLKFWYEEFEISLWKSYKKGEAEFFHTFLLFSPFFVIGGLIPLLIFEFMYSKDNVWWYKTPEVEE